MFAALTVARLREAIQTAGLLDTKAWVSPDDVKPIDLPLARAVEKVLASMHVVLERTMTARDRELEAFKGTLNTEEFEKMTHLRKTKAAEVRLVRNVGAILAPDVMYSAEELITE
jgi:pyridoxine kinase